MTRLVEDSVTITDGMTIQYPEIGVETKLTGISKIIESFHNKRVYCVKDGVLGFIANDDFHVTPLTGKKLVYLVEKQNFERAEFPIPLSDGGMPKNYGGIWEELIDDAENPG